MVVGLVALTSSPRIGKRTVDEPAISRLKQALAPSEGEWDHSVSWSGIDVALEGSWSIAAAAVGSSSLAVQLARSSSASWEPEPGSAL